MSDDPQAITKKINPSIDASYSPSYRKEKGAGAFVPRGTYSPRDPAQDNKSVEALPAPQGKNPRVVPSNRIQDESASPYPKWIPRQVRDQATAPTTARLVDDYVGQPMDLIGQPKPILNYTDPDLLYLWYNKMPELRAIPEVLISDIWGEGFEIDGSEARVKKVKRFLRNNNFLRVCKSTMRDEFITGNGYCLKAGVTEGQVLGLMEQYYQHTLQKSADDLEKMQFMALVKANAPDLYATQVLLPLMSRSIRIDYDKHGAVLAYIQRVKNWNTGQAFATAAQGNPDNPDTYAYGTMGTTPYGIRFAPEEVIHFAFQPVGDQIYGTSPFAASIYDIAALWYAKNYGGMFFENDATPDFIYMLKNESPQSDNYKNFVEQLKKFKLNPHKSMVITGEVDLERVNPLAKDLEFATFIEKYTQRILMPWGLTARFSHLTGKLEVAQNLEGYYKMINSIQTDWEEKMNAELFESFDVEFTFKKVYKRDESREADIVSKVTNLCISPNEAREYLGYKRVHEGDPEYTPEMDEVISQQPAQMVPLDENGKPKAKPLSEIASADNRSNQNSEHRTGPGKMKGDAPVNNKKDK